MNRSIGICAGSNRSSCASRPSLRRLWNRFHRLRRVEHPAAIRELIAQLRQMPGIGPRSAERIALWMVQSRHDQPEQISKAIATTRQAIHPCKLCGFFATEELCEICRDASRTREVLCIVEQATDI